MGRANPLDRKGWYSMSAETCTRSQCPEMPKVTLDQAVIDLMESIALQETALSHILCAESQKMKVAMGLDGLTCASCWRSTTRQPTWCTPWPTWSSCSRISWSSSPTTSTIRLPAAAVPLTSKALCLPGCRAGIFVYRLFTESLHKNRKMHLLELLRRTICAIL